MKLDPISRATRPHRKEVLMGEKEAAALIKDGDVVIVGGFGTVNHPMPIIRALIRHKVKNLTVIGAATAGLEIDLLIGAGCVKKVIAPYIGAELHAPIGHCYRRAAESDEVEVYETTEYLLYSQLDAAARGLGFLPWRGGVGTSLPTLNPDYVPFNDPINGEPYLRRTRDADRPAHRAQQRNPQESLGYLGRLCRCRRGGAVRLASLRQSWLLCRG